MLEGCDWMKDAGGEWRNTRKGAKEVQVSK